MPQDTLTESPRRPSATFLAAGVVVLSAVMSWFYFHGMPGSPRGTSRSTSGSFDLDLTTLLEIDPGLIGYTQSLQFPTGFSQARSMAAGPRGRIYVVGDHGVRVFDQLGNLKNEIPFDGKPTTVAVGGADHVEPGQIYVGMEECITVILGDLVRDNWQLPTTPAELTSITVGYQDVFACDAISRQVWRFRPDGELVGRMGETGTEVPIPAFVVPSPHFDAVVGGEDLIHVVNPGKLQISTFSFGGDLGTSWGETGASVSKFFGCCNPVHLALLPDGRFVTSEKGIPRIKVYSPQGVFESVVAGPKQLGIADQSVGDPRLSQHSFVYDVAVTSDGQVLVLDPRSRDVLVFVEKGPMEQL